MPIPIELEEDDGRWLAEAPDLPGVLAYGPTRAAAADAARALALRVLADRVEHGEVTLLSEAALAVDWSRPEEDAAWEHLQTGAMPTVLRGHEKDRHWQQ